MKKILLSILCCMLAVFSVQAEEVTYTVTLTSAVSATGDVLSGSSVTYSSTYGTKCQLTKNNSMTLTLSGYAGCKITGITMSMKSNKSSGSGNFSMVAGETTLSSIATAAFSNNAWNGAWSTSYVDVTPTMSNANYTIADDEKVVITIAATANSLYCQSFKITYEVGGAVTPTAKKPVISPESCEFNMGETLYVTITQEEDADIHYTLDGTEPDENSALYSGPLEIKETTTVKAIAIINDYNNSAVVEATYTAIDPNAPTATLSFADDAKRISHNSSQQVWKQNGVTFTNAKAESTTDVGTYSNPVRLYKNSTITIESEREFDEIVFDCTGGEYQTNLENSLEGETVDGDLVTITFEPTTSYTITLTGGQARLDALTVVYAVEEEPISHTLTVSEAGYATLFLGFDAAIPEGTEAYVVKEEGINDTYISLTQVTDVIPANTGVIVKANKGTYEFVYSAETKADVTGNLLTGTTENAVITKDAEKEYYILANGEIGVGLYKPTIGMDATQFNNAANKAYLVVPAAQAEGVASYSFRFGEGTTGISEVKGENGNVKAIYDLTGRKVETISAPGIYIINGVKTLVK